MVGNTFGPTIGDWAMLMDAPAFAMYNTTHSKSHFADARAEYNNFVLYDDIDTVGQIRGNDFDRNYWGHCCETADIEGKTVNGIYYPPYPAFGRFCLNAPPGSPGHWIYEKHPQTAAFGPHPDCSGFRFLDHYDEEPEPLLGEPPSMLTPAQVVDDHPRFGPVDAYDGQLEWSESDIAIEDAGKTIAIDRSYRSSATSGTAGPGWLTSFNETASIEAGSFGGAVDIGFGRQLDFNADPLAGFVRSAGNHANWDADEYGAAMASPDGTQLDFDEQGTLTSVSSRDPGRTIDISHSGGNIDRITGVSGRWLQHSFSGALLSSISDSQQRSVSYGYAGGRLDTVTGVDSKTRSYDYDAEGRLVKVTSAAGVVELEAAYDGDGRVAWFERAGEGRVTVEYVPEGQYTLFHRADGTTVRQDYDGLGRNVHETVGDVTATHTVYDGEGHVIATITGVPTASRTAYAPQADVTLYDGDGNPAQVFDPNGRVTTTTFTEDHRPLVTTRPDGTTVSRVYNPITKRLAMLVDPANNDWNVEYNAFGQVVSITDPLDRVRTWDYDTDTTDGDPATGDPESVANTAQETTVYETDAFGRIKKVTDPTQAATTYDWTPWGEIKTVTTPWGGVTDRTFDNDRRIVDVTGPGGEPEPGSPIGGPARSRTQNVYDAAGRLQQVVQHDDSTGAALTRTTTYGFDAVGNVDVVTDPRGKQWTQDQDAAGRVIWRRDPRGGGEDLVLDPAGRVVEHRRILDAGVPPVVATTTTTYDRAGNVTKVVHPDAGVESFTYDAMNREVSHKQPRQVGAEIATWTTTYDTLGRPDLVTDPLDGIVDHDYDAVGRLTQVRDQNLDLTVYTYDAADRMVSVSDPVDRADPNDAVLPRTFVTYDDAGRPLTRRNGDGEVTTYQYYPTGLLQRETDAEGGYREFEYDKAGRERKVTQLVQAGQTRVTSTWSNDYGEMVRRDRPGGTFEQLGYDGNGNVTLRRDRTGATWTYQYDDANHQTHVIDPVNGGAHPTVTAVDLGGRATSVTDPSGVTVSYGYDGLDRKTSEVHEATTNPSTWLWWPDGTVREANTDGNLVRYEYDLGGRLAREFDGAGNTGNDATAYVAYGYDGVGRRTMVKPRGEEPRTTVYDARGRVVQEQLVPVAGTTHTTEQVYDGADRVLSTLAFAGTTRPTDPAALLRQEHVTYDDAGRVEQSWRGSLPHASFEYYADGQLKASHLPRGGVFAYEYDPAGFLDAEVRPDLSRWEFDHDEEGRLEVVRPPSGQDVTHTLDALGRVDLTSVVDPLGGPNQVRDLSYDRSGRLTGAQDQHAAAGGTLQAVLVVGNPAAMTAADTILGNRLVNSLGFTVTVVDDAADPGSVAGDVAVVAASAVALHSGWATKAMPVVAVAGTTWNELGLASADPSAAASSSTIFVEDTSHPIGDGPERAVPDTATWVTSARTPFQVGDGSLGAGATDVVATASGSPGSNVLVAYEATSAMAPVGGPLAAPARRVGVGFGDGALAVMTVDGWALLDNAIWWARGHVLAGDGSTWTFGYDDAGRLTTSDGPNDDVTQTYDAWGRLSTATVAGRSVTYAYNNRGLVSGLTGATTMTVAWTNARRFDYASVGSRKLDVTYDAAGRPTTTAILDGSTPRWSSTVTYDAAGRVDTRVEGAAGAAVTDDYGYDAAGRLTQLDRTFGAGSASLTIGYDADGNRTSVDANGATTGSAADPLSAAALGVPGNDPQTWAWDLAGRLSSASDGTAHTYDADGRLTQVIAPGQPTRGYGYDLFGDLTTVTQSTGGVTTTVTSYENDALGRPVRMAGESGAATTLSYAGTSDDSLAQRSPARVANPVTVATNVPGVGRVAVWDATRGNQLVATNSHGDVAAVAVTATGAAPHTVRVFSPFGTPAELGANLDGLPLGFQGDLTDAGTGLVDMGARTYDPITGRFLQADTFAGVASNPATLNRYAYGNGDPVNHIDPDGHFAFMRKLGEQVKASIVNQHLDRAGVRDGRGRELERSRNVRPGYKSSDCQVRCNGQAKEQSDLVASYISYACGVNGGIADFTTGGFSVCWDPDDYEAEQTQIARNTKEMLEGGDRNWLCAGWGVLKDRCNGAMQTAGEFGRGFFVEGPKAFATGLLQLAKDPGAALEKINAQCNKGMLSCAGALTGLDGAIGCVQNAGGASDLGSCASQVAMGFALGKGLGKAGRGAPKGTATIARHADDGADMVMAARATPGRNFPEVETPYGVARQHTSPGALAARHEIGEGATVWRTGTTGRSQTVKAQFWTTEHPSTPGFAGRYGIPPENVANADFIESAVVRPGTPFVTRPAPAVGPNPGGGIEVVVPEGGVQMCGFSWIGPKDGC